MATATTTGALKGLDFKGATESFFLGRLRGVSLESLCSVERAALKQKKIYNTFPYFCISFFIWPASNKMRKGGRVVVDQDSKSLRKGRSMA